MLLIEAPSFRVAGRDSPGRRHSRRSRGWPRQHREPTERDAEFLRPRGGRSELACQLELPLSFAGIVDVALDDL